MEIKFDYGGKNFIVLGASSGIGKQIALELSQSGANVLCLARRVELIDKLQEFQGAGKIISGFIDVTKYNGEVIDKFIDDCGKISGAVYTAGIAGLTPLRQFDEDLAQQIMNTSYCGMLKFIQSVAKKSASVEGASFVVFSSVAAHCGEKGQLIYSAAKSAVMSSVKVIAKEISKNKFRINSISPGWIETEINAGAAAYGVERSTNWLGEGTAADVSGMVMFLLSNRAKWITGTDIVIDGGQLLGNK